jgi:hypothetical protein
LGHDQILNGWSIWDNVQGDIETFCCVGFGRISHPKCYPSSR